MTDSMEMDSFIGMNSERAFQLAMEEADFADRWEAGGLVDGELDLAFPVTSLEVVAHEEREDWADEDFVADREADVMGWDDNA